MAARPSRTLSLLILLSAASGQLLSAQCPDGSAPPCSAVERSATGTVDSNAVAILPFRVSGPAAADDWMREGLSDLLSMSLDGVAGWRVISPRTVLARARQSSTPVDLRNAMRFAHSLGAGGVIMGQAVIVGTQLRLHVELYHAGRGERLAVVEASGAAVDPGPLVDTLAVGLARHRLANRSVGSPSLVREYITASPRALRSYLVAEQLARQGAWQAAADSLQVAIAHDSLFGLAYYRLMVATSFGAVGSGSGPTLIDAATRHANRLPPRQRDILLTTLAQRLEQRSAALRLADVLGPRYPDDAEAAYAQGESYFHFGLAMGYAPARVLEPFERAIGLDPNLLDPYNHAIELLCITGDTVRAWLLLERALTLAPGSGTIRSVELAMRTGMRREDPVDVLAALQNEEWRVAAHLRAIIEVPRMLDQQPATAVTLADSLAGLAGHPGQPHTSRVLGLRKRTLHRLAQGRYRQAWQTLGDAWTLEPDNLTITVIAAVFPLMTGYHSVQARAAVRELVGLGPVEITQGIVAWVALEQGDTAAYTEAMDRLKSAPGTTAKSRAERSMAGLEGLAALRRADTALARERFGRAADLGSYGGGFISDAAGVYFTLQLARLEHAAGLPESATRRLYVTFLDSEAGMVFRAEAEELRGQLYQQLGEPVRAIRAYRNFIALWEHADPELQPRVEAAREALRRLE